MDKPISVGDLVQVVAWPCCGKELGFVFRVSATFTGRNNGYCSHCMNMGHHGGTAKVRSDMGHLYLVRHLKRIPPLEELDDVKRDEEITA